MKSLILKDIYNIMHNMKALVLMLFIFLFITIPQGGAAAYVITCCNPLRHDGCHHIQLR